MRIGLFGGSMDPIHNGHIHAIAFAIQEARLDRIHVTVAGNPYHKDAPSAPALQRFDWVRQACREYFDPNVVVADDQEVLREGPTYTIDTVRELKAKYPRAQLIYVVGEDVPNTMSKWKDSDELLASVELFVVSRDVIPISSTDIRALASQKRPITGLVPRSIEADILKKALYNKHS